MSIIDVLSLIFIFVSILLICVVLLQPGKGDATAIGFGGSSQSIFGSRGAGNFLTKTTGVLAALFFITSFFLTKSRVDSVRPTDVRSNLPIEAAPTPAPATQGTAPVASPTPSPEAPAKKK